MTAAGDLTAAIESLEKARKTAILNAALRAIEVAGAERKGVTDNDVLVRQARDEAVRRAVSATIGDLERIPTWETNYLSSGLPMTTYIPGDKMPPSLPFVHAQVATPKADTPTQSWWCCRTRKNL